MDTPLSLHIKSSHETGALKGALLTDTDVLSSFALSSSSNEVALGFFSDDKIRRGVVVAIMRGGDFGGRGGEIHMGRLGVTLGSSLIVFGLVIAASVGFKRKGFSYVSRF